MDGVVLAADRKQSDRRGQRFDKAGASAINGTAPQHGWLPDERAHEPLAVAQDQTAITEKIRQSSDHLLDRSVRDRRPIGAIQLGIVVDPERELEFADLGAPAARP